MSQRPTIQKIRRPRPRVDRLRLVLDDGAELDLAEELILEAGLREGEAVDRALLVELEARDEVFRARDAALNLLAHRARSTRELERRLARKGFSEDAVQRTIAAMEERGYLDDAAFAAAFVRDRLRLRPRGRRRLNAELRAKGVPPGTAEEAVERTFDEAEVSEAQLAVRAAEAWAARNTVPDADQDRDARQRARQRLYGYLSRRGFAPDAVREAMASVLEDD